MQNYTREKKKWEESSQRELEKISINDLNSEVSENIFIKHNHTSLMKKLRSSKIACGILNEIEDLELHSQLRKIVCKIDDKEIDVIAPPAIFLGEKKKISSIPKLGEHSKLIREEFYEKK